MLAPYRALLALPGARRLVLCSLVGRIPYGMTGFALLLYVRDVSGSFAAAGAVAGINLATVCVGGPAQGRIIDRVGQPPVLLVCGATHLGALVLTVVLGEAGAPVAALAVCAGLAGAFVPPLSPSLRTLWPGLVARGRADRSVLDTAYAFEAVAIEVLFVVGPLLAAVLIAVASPAAAMIAGGLLALVGSAGFATAEASRTWTAERNHAPHWLGPLRARPVLALLAVAVPHGMAVGLIEIALPAFADGVGARELAGVLIAAWAIGSLAGGVAYGARRFRESAAGRLVLLHLVLAATAAPLLLGSNVVGLAALCVLCGLPLSATAACLYALLADIAPAGEETEANTWLISGIVAGLAMGGALSGTLVEEAGTDAAFGAASVAFLVAGVVAAGARRTLAATPARAPVRSAA